MTGARLATSLLQRPPGSPRARFRAQTYEYIQAHRHTRARAHRDGRARLDGRLGDGARHNCGVRDGRRRRVVAVVEVGAVRGLLGQVGVSLDVDAAGWERGVGLGRGAGCGEGARVSAAGMKNRASCVVVVGGGSGAHANRGGEGAIKPRLTRASCPRRAPPRPRRPRRSP